MAGHIETPRSEGFDEAAKRRVAASLALAATLGATIATVPAETVVAGLRSQIEGMRATQVVIGKSQRSWWFEFRHGSVVDALVKGAQGVAVHVIPSGAEGETSSDPLRTLLKGWGRPRSYAVIALMIAGTT